MSRLLFLLILIPFSAFGQDDECTCCSVERNQFDFWIGEWDVYAKDQLVGHNTIAKILDGCALSEEWVSAAGNKGNSYNYYDEEYNHWNQVWVDDSGSNLELSGFFTGEKMILKTNPKRGENGEIIIDRISWTPLENGDVRQLWERSKDTGGTWEPVFNGLYKKVSP